MIDIFTNFEYKDERKYVHSTTMCEFLWERLVPLLKWQASDICLDARFHRWAINNGIMRCQEKPNDSPLGIEVTAEFRLFAGSQTYYIYFIEGEKPVLNRIASNYEIEDLKSLSPFAGSCRIKISDTRSFLENTIEANKRLHQAAFPQKEKMKIINLYMKRFPIGNIPRKKDWYTLKIHNINTRYHNDGLATLNRFSFPEFEVPVFEMCYFLPGVGV